MFFEAKTRGNTASVTKEHKFFSGNRKNLVTDRKSALMTKVKANSKSQLVENREGKSALYRCNFLL